MADQPLNVEIQIFRTVRTQREIVRHDSVGNIVKKLRALILVEPGNELRTEYGTRTTNVSDFSSFMGMARPYSTGTTLQRGLPVTIGVRAVKDFHHVEHMTGIDFPVEIGSDKFIQENTTQVGNDIQLDARNS